MEELCKMLMGQAITARGLTDMVMETHKQMKSMRIEGGEEEGGAAAAKGEGKTDKNYSEAEGLTSHDNRQHSGGKGKDTPL